MVTRYLLQALPSGEMLSWDLPLEGVDLSLSLSAPTVMSATITHERPELVGLLRPYHVAIWVDDDSGDLHGGILTDIDADGPKVSLTVAGYAYYPTGQPWTDAEYQGIRVDPLDVVRRIWDRLQAIPGGDLHLEVDTTKSKVTVGEPERDVNFTDSNTGEEVSFEAGPYKLNYWGTADVGKEFADLIERAGATYLERHYWDGETIRHRLQIDCPGRAVRRDDLRFVVGENVIVPPKLSLPGTGYASEVLVLGAGEGRDARYASSGPVNTGGLYRAAVYSDKSITSNTKAQSIARAQAKKLSGDLEQITELLVLDHPNADLRSILPGDVIRVSGDTEWIELDTYARVTDISFNPATPHEGSLTIEVI